MIKIKNIFALLPALFLQVLLFAQDKKVDVDIDVNKKSGGDWYTQPWVWIVGAAVFIIILVAILSGRNKE